MPSPIFNYAEQVLREEAERLANLKQINQNSKNSSSYASVHEEKIVIGVAKVNLKDEDSFPTLGKAKTNSKLSYYNLSLIFFIYLYHM